MNHDDIKAEIKQLRAELDENLRQIDEIKGKHKSAINQVAARQVENQGVEMK